MFISKSPQDDVIKLRSALSDIKFLAQETLKNEDDMSEKIKSIFDDVIKVADIGMFSPRADNIQRAKEKMGGCCGDTK
jgi:hypothetical protein